MQYCLSPALGKSLDPAFPSAFLVKCLVASVFGCIERNDEFMFVWLFLSQKNMSDVLSRSL